MQAEYIIFSNDGKQRGKIMANATIIPLKNSYLIRGFVEGHTQATGGAPPPPPSRLRGRRQCRRDPPVPGQKRTKEDPSRKCQCARVTVNLMERFNFENRNYIHCHKRICA